MHSTYSTCLRNVLVLERPHRPYRRKKKKQSHKIVQSPYMFANNIIQQPLLTNPSSWVPRGPLSHHPQSARTVKENARARAVRFSEYSNVGVDGDMAVVVVRCGKYDCECECECAALLFSCWYPHRRRRRHTHTHIVHYVNQSASAVRSQPPPPKPP